MEKGVFLVDLKEEQYIVRPAGKGDTVIFEGNREEFDTFKEQYKESVFIIDDIPRD